MTILFSIIIGTIIGLFVVTCMSILIFIIKIAPMLIVYMPKFYEELIRIRK